MNSLVQLRRIIREEIARFMVESSDDDDELMQDSIKFGTLAKQLFEKYRSPAKFSNYVKVHWVGKESDALNFLNDKIVGEVSVNVYPEGTEIENLTGTWRDVGLQLDGKVTLYSTEDMFTGASGHRYAGGEKFPTLDELFMTLPDNLDEFFEEDVDDKDKLNIMRSMGFRFNPPKEVLKHNEALLLNPSVVAVYVPNNKKDVYANLIKQCEIKTVPVYYK